MSLRFSVLCLVLVISGALLPLPEANAGLILGGFGVQTWERLPGPGTSPGFTLTISPEVSSDPSSLWTFALAVVIVPTANATGTLEVGPRSIPATNPLFGGNYELPFADASQVGDATVFTVDHDQFLVDWNVTGLTNAVDLAFTSNNAQGLFQIWARPDIDGTGLTYFYSDSSDDDYAFTNIPFGGDDFLLGTLDVSVVPEPSSFALLAVLGGGIGLIMYRRRRRERSSEVQKSTC